MSRTKKFIIIAVSVAVALAAENGDDNRPKPPDVDILERVCTIYEQKTGVAIDQAALKDAFAQARSEIQKEWQQARLQDMVSQGKITQEEADQFLNWWESKPNVPFGFGFQRHGRFHGMGGPCAPPPPPSE
jgi:hypothetical protein